MAKWPSSDDPELLFEDGEHVLMAWRNVFIERNVGRPSAEGMRRDRVWMEACCARYPGQAAHLIIVPNRASVPDGGARQGALDLLRWYGDLGIAGFVVELNGRGFWAAAARGATSRMLLAARIPTPVLISGGRDETTRWLEEKSGRAMGWSATDLDDATHHPKISLSPLG